MNKKIFLILLFSLGLYGCSSGGWSQKRCESTPWEQTGFMDGSTGRQNSAAAYATMCARKGIHIDLTSYNQGYKSGVKAFCTYETGESVGASNAEIHNHCRRFPGYVSGYKAGLSSFCSYETGENSGLSNGELIVTCRKFKNYMKGYKAGMSAFCSFEAGKEVGINDQETVQNCRKFDQYIKGYAAGMKVFCSPQKAYEAAIEQKDPIAKCMRLKSYVAGYDKGQKDFCSAENGERLGRKGHRFPEKCENADPAFAKAFNTARIGFLEDVLKDKELTIEVQRKEYHKLRDDLQDMQFELGRFPRVPASELVIQQKRTLELRMAKLRSERDKQREKVDLVDREIGSLRKEISFLKRRI